jgi:hypothetical protein
VLLLLLLLQLLHQQLLLLLRCLRHVLLRACRHAAAECAAIIQHHLCSAGQHPSQLQCSIPQVDNEALPGDGWPGSSAKTRYSTQLTTMKHTIVSTAHSDTAIPVQTGF